MLKYPSFENDHFELDDAEKRNHDHPETFHIPSQALRTNLKPGDIVKLIFLIENSLHEQPGAERMWVIVTESQSGRYRGRLDSYPVTIGAIQYGHELAFGPEHVIAIHDKRAVQKRIERVVH